MDRHPSSAIQDIWDSGRSNRSMERRISDTVRSSWTVVSRNSGTRRSRDKQVASVRRLYDSPDIELRAIRSCTRSCHITAHFTGPEELI